MAKVLSLYLMVGEPDLTSTAECPDCGFDSLLKFPLTLLDANGVSPVGTYEACPRCYFDEGQT